MLAVDDIKKNNLSSYHMIDIMTKMSKLPKNIQKFQKVNHNKMLE